MSVRKIIDSPWLYFGLAGLLLALAVTTQLNFDRPPERDKGTAFDMRALADRDDVNVIFIVIDMLRADRLSAYGYHRQTSPFMDSLAARGVRFSTVESQSSWTKASMASMWTGLYPQRTGVQRFMNAVPMDATMPAEIFQEAGYVTAGIWRNGWTANNFNFGQGFSIYHRPTPNRRPQKVKRRNPSAHALQGTDLDATESAMEFIRANFQDPFFLYVHYMDVHQYLYADISPDFGSSFSDIYDSSIFWVDRNVQFLVESLRDLGLENKTMIVIASDHGEAFFEHGTEGHARMLYREVQEVPWIIVPPFELEEPVVVNPRVANVDIWPTMLEILGLPGLPDAEGHPLLDLIEAAARGEHPDPKELGDRPVYAQLDLSWGHVDAEEKPIVSLSKGSRRFISSVISPENNRQLFDRANDDAMEKKDVAPQRPEEVDELLAEVRGFLLDGPKWESPEVELDEMHRAQLKALGYVVERKGARSPDEIKKP